jgi:hypothetical protein
VAIITDLRDKLLNRRQRLFLYGTTPPRSDSPRDVIERAAKRLAERVHDREFDAIVVYDIQEESGRTQAERPFPFTETIDPREYASLLRHLTGGPTITYKSLGNLDEEAWSAWLDESTADPEFRALSIVGRPTSRVTYELSLAKAIQLAAAHPSQIAVGGVAIAERQTKSGNEGARLLAKTLDGCSYFISQTVYSAEPTKRMLLDYITECDKAGVMPRRVVLTFAPCGRERTMQFLRWLGVNVPADVARSILASEAPAARSIEICRDNLCRILEHTYDLPLGINVETVSLYKDEIEASIELADVLSEVL